MNFKSTRNYFTTFLDTFSFSRIFKVLQSTVYFAHIPTLALRNQSESDFCDRDKIPTEISFVDVKPIEINPSLLS